MNTGNHRGDRVNRKRTAEGRENLPPWEWFVE
jgi:hypothetical protein